MQRVGCPVPSALDGLDLLQQHLLRADQQTVNAPLDAQDELARLDLMAEAHLLLVAGRAGALEPLMAAGARQGAVRPDEVAPAAKVALPQGELDEFPHWNEKTGFKPGATRQVSGSARGPAIENMLLPGPQSHWVGSLEVE